MIVLNLTWNCVFQIALDIIIRAIPLIISTFIGAWIVRKSFVPKVDIMTKKEHILKDSGGYFVSLNVVNVGPNVAQDCCAYIILDSRIDGENFLNPCEATANEHLPNYTDEHLNFEIPRDVLITREKQRDVQQIQLCWTHHGNPYHMNLNPGVQSQIDICRYQIYEKDPTRHYILFPTEKGWRRVHFRLQYQELKGKLYICPANSYPNVFDIEFSLSSGVSPKIIIKKKRMNYFTRKKLLLK